MNIPRLSICVPTYQRPALLVEALDTIAAQWADDLTDDQRCQIEILVSDNHSPDKTPEVIAQFAEAHPKLPLVHVRQPKNIGASANVLFLVGMATGEYVYWHSDDDLLLPGALASMLTLIHEYPAMPAFCLNTRSFFHDPAAEITLPSYAMETDQTISEGSQCLQFVGNRITFLSLLMFRRDRVTQEGYQSCCQTMLLPAYVFLDVLAGGAEMYVTRQVFLAVRGNNTGGYNFYEVFVSQFADLMRYAQTRGYSEAVIRTVLARHLRDFILPFTASFKLHGSYGQLQPDFRDGFRRLRAEYGLHPLLMFGILPLMLAPHILVAGIHRVTRRRKGKTE